MSKIGTVVDLSRLQLDRGSPVPLYFQIERLIEREIATGQLKVGDKLPAEPECAGILAVSRSVVRQALDRLEEAGLVSRIRGQGTFVAATQDHSWQLQALEGFFENEVARLGRNVTTRVLRATTEPLPDWAAELLGAQRATTGVVLERVRSVDDLLTLYDVNYLPEQYTEAVMSLRTDAQGSLYEALRRQYGIAVAGGHRIVDAVAATELLATTLDVKLGEPLLLVEAVDLDAERRPFDCYRTWVRPDRLKVEVRVTPPPDPRRSRHVLLNRKLREDAAQTV